MFLGICSDALSSGQFPVPGRGHAADFPEGREEIVLVLVTEFEGYFLYGLGGVCQQFLGHVDTHFLNVL